MKTITVSKNGGIEIHAIGVYTGTVDDSADLKNVPSEAQEGSRYHTVGWGDCWEKRKDGAWVSLKDGSVVTP